MTADPVAGFAATYAEARERFLEAAKARGLPVTRHVHPVARGAQGEELSIDVASLGRAEARPSCDPAPEVRDIYPLRPRPCAIPHEDVVCPGAGPAAGPPPGGGGPADQGGSVRQKAAAPFGVPSPVGPS